MPGVVILNPEMVDGYRNPLQTTWDPGTGAYRLLTSTKVSSRSVIPNAPNVTGTITTLGGTVEAAAEGWSSCAVVVTGTWSGALIFEQSCDGGATWTGGGFVQSPISGSPIPVLLSYITSNNSYQTIGMGPTTNVRIKSAVFASGTANIRFVFSDALPAMLSGFSQIQQNITSSTYNSSTANLAAGASFTGTGETTLGIAGIQVQFKASQPCIIQVQQSIDNTNWDVDDEILVIADKPRARTVQAVGNYFRIIVTNIGNTTTSYLRLSVDLCPVVEALPRMLTNYGKLSLATQRSSWFPSDQNFTIDGTTRPELFVDSDGRLETRSGVVSDASSFRDDFTAGELYVDISGTTYFTNNSMYVTGNGTSFLSQVKISNYIKLSSHADAYYVQVSDVLSDTLLILDSEYSGVTGSGTGRLSNWKYIIGTGGSVAQSSSEIVITAGTTNGAVHIVERSGDYMPFVATFKLRISQRIANQELKFGFSDSNVGTPESQAMIVFSGTDNTQATLRTSFSSFDVENTTITLPGGLVTTTSAYYKIEVCFERISLFVNDFKAAEHKMHIPGPYMPMNCHHEIKNTGVPASSTIVYNDVFFFSNFDQVQITAAPKGDPITVKELRANIAICTNVSAAAADTLLLTANANRLGATVHNDSLSILYLKFGSGASSTSFTVRMTSYAYYEVPFGYTGQINGRWVSATGTARITEIT